MSDKNKIKVVIKSSGKASVYFDEKMRLYEIITYISYVEDLLYDCKHELLNNPDTYFTNLEGS